MHPTRPPRQRSPLNNPTERIQRLLDTFDSVQAYYESLEDALAKHVPEVMATLPPQPDISSFLLEAQRQQFTYAKTLKARRYMARMRSASDGPALASNAKQQLRAIAEHGLTEERKREIMALVSETAAMPEAVTQAIREQLGPKPAAELLDTAAAHDAAVGLPAGVEIEPDPETSGIEQDLKDGSLFK